MASNQNSASIKYSSEKVSEHIERLLPLAETIESQFVHGIGIYGAGFVGTWACEYLKSLGANIRLFIDKDPQKSGKHIQGVPIVSPNDPSVDLVSSLLIAARHFVKDVQSLMADKCSHSLSFDAYFVIRNYDRLCEVRDNLLSDSKSVNIFNAILISMLTSSLDACLDVMEKDMYFSLPEFSGTFDEIFVDAGAFVGDSVEKFIWENLGTFRHIYAFEPGQRQFKALQKRMLRLAEEWAFDSNRVSLEQAGLGAEPSEMSYLFAHDFPLRHALGTADPLQDKDNIITCPVYPLDTYLDGRPVTFIKVDIEGMEMNFLHGAKKTIQKYKPKMAVCVYHYPSDLFEVAEYIHTMVPEYKFSLRHHAPILGDFVLYCYL